MVSAITVYVLSVKTFYKDSICYTGTIATATQVTPNINVSPTGLITASATQSAGYVSSGTKEATKQLSTKSATTYTPSAINQIISSGYYLTGTQTIKGDSNLVASNIKSGVSIFGVNGTYTSNYHEFWDSGIIYSNNYTFTITLQDLSADKCIIRMFIRSSASVINSDRIACLDFDAISNVRL